MKFTTTFWSSGFDGHDEDYHPEADDGVEDAGEAFLILTNCIVHGYYFITSFVRWKELLLPI